MATIEVESHSPDTFAVRVQGDTTTMHEVRVTDETVEALGLGDVERARLVEASFEFLLEREPNTSILSSFELGEIERYFGEYPDQIRARLSG